MGRLVRVTAIALGVALCVIPSVVAALVSLSGPGVPTLHLSHPSWEWYRRLVSDSALQAAAWTGVTVQLFHAARERTRLGWRTY